MKFDLSTWPLFPNHNEPTYIDSVSIDSRYISGDNALFVALPGVNVDGHHHVAHALASGAKFALVSDAWTPPDHIDHTKLIKVASPIKALQHLATTYRNTLATTIVGVAGSCGKTMLKDLLGLFFTNTTIFISPESFNSQIGVALSLLSIPAHATLAFIEMAATKSGEMRSLINMAQPESAIVTNFYRNRFSDALEKETVAQQIQELVISLPKQGFALIEKDERINIRAATCSILYWDNPSLGPYIQKQVAATTSMQQVTCTFPCGHTASLALHITHKYIVELVSIAVYAAWLFKIPPQHITETLLSYEPQEMRTEIWKNKNSITFVNSTYSHSIFSLHSSLKDIESYLPPSHYGKKFLLFGGLTTDTIESNVIRTCKAHGIDTIFCFSNHWYQKLSSQSEIPVFPEESLTTALHHIQTIAQPHDTVIIKGPTKNSFSSIFAALDGFCPRTTACINLAAVRENIAALRKKLSPNIRIMVMVKALAYGTDDVQMSHFLRSCGIDILGVSYVDEGISMRKAGVAQSIFVINAPVDEIKMAAQYNLEIGVSSKEQIIEAQKYGALKLHLHVDTGMKRFGCQPKDAFALAQLIAHSSDLTLEGLFTHFAVADDPAQDSYTLEQSRLLTQVYDQLSQAGIAPLFCHACNSSAAMRFDFPQCNMVRVGLLPYGIHPSSCSKTLIPLQPAISLISQIVGCNEAGPGDTVSYGRTYTVHNKNTRLAVLPIGYYDGLHRSYSGKGYVLIRGEKAPMVGRICMDYMMVDISHIPQASIGDSAVLFGEDEKGHYLSPEVLAEAGGSIVHELMTCIGPRVQRIFIYDESLQTR